MENVHRFDAPDYNGSNNAKSKEITKLLIDYEFMYDIARAQYLRPDGVSVPLREVDDMTPTELFMHIVKTCGYVKNGNHAGVIKHLVVMAKAVTA